MPDIALKVLQEYKTWQNKQRLELGELWENNKASEDSEERYFVFTQWNGKPIFPNTASSWFRKFRRKNNLPDIPFHGIRHSNASVLISENIDLQTIAKRLGHTKPTTTAQIYSHFLSKPDKIAAEKLDSIFNKDSNKKQG
jgi:integrase